MKFTTFAVLASAVAAQSNSTSNSTEWQPAMCETTEDCMTPEILDGLTLAYPEVQGTMDDIICAYFEVGEGDDEDGEIIMDICTFTANCESEGNEAGEWWYIGCDGASNLVAAGTAALMLAYAM